MGNANKPGMDHTRYVLVGRMRDASEFWVFLRTTRPSRKRTDIQQQAVQHCSVLKRWLELHATTKKSQSGCTRLASRELTSAESVSQSVTQSVTNHICSSSRKRYDPAWTQLTYATNLLPSFLPCLRAEHLITYKLSFPY